MRTNRHGVTLIELMVVMSIIAILLGIGMAMMSESNKDLGLRAARSSVLGICRFAKTAARNSRAPVSVRIDPDGKYIATVIRKPMAAWHFEDNSLEGAFARSARLTNGKVADDGRVGKGISFTDAGGSIDCGSVPLYASDQGLLVEIWYRPKFHKRDRVLVQKAGEFGLGLSKLGTLQGWVGGETDRVGIQMSDAPLPEGRWSKVSMLWDGTSLTLLVNDFPIARKTPKKSDPTKSAVKFPMTDNPLMVGAKEFPLDGWVDELRVDALIEESRTQIRDPLVVKGPAEIRWDETGALDPAINNGAATITITSPVDSASVTVNMLGGSQ